MNTNNKNVNKKVKIPNCAKNLYYWLRDLNNDIIDEVDDNGHHEDAQTLFELMERANQVHIHRWYFELERKFDVIYDSDDFVPTNNPTQFEFFKHMKRINEFRYG
ncbi:hypothetical protein [Vibrio barjaei]|uniref:hypothetical protein n=1 Tax=Vibrio barjaei TaxID=1676683 RepID=UPI0022845B9C|nr:hypothetical protein [Vibrio barjaei]MCY9874611.1 hypothetical protein [Vibrio barjaei]